MERVMHLLRNLFPGKWGRGRYDAEGLRLAFRARYHHFKLLLNANNKALSVMGEISEALRGIRPFGMRFIRSRCTAVSTNVFQIVRNLNELAPRRYPALSERFKEIQKTLNPHIVLREMSLEGPAVIPMEEIHKDMADLVGGKLANLGEIAGRLRVKAPAGFAITAAAYWSFMKENDLQPEIDRRIQSTDLERLDQLYSLSASIQQMIIGSRVPEEIAREIRQHYSRLAQKKGTKTTVAMRSSALGEDLPGASFAGQYRSELNVSGENILEAYKEIIASKYGLTAMIYRFHRGIRDEDVAMCVGCMDMVDALAGGVAYSRNPLLMRDDAIVIHSVWGLPKSVVDGNTACDVFLVSRDSPHRIRHKEIARKEQKFVCYPEEGVCRMDLSGEKASEASLSDAQALEIARLTMIIEDYCRTPQDVEWALDQEGSLLLLQCRPLLQRDTPGTLAGTRTGSPASEKILLEGGITASPGIAAGPVYVVRRDMDVLRFPAGAVLVAAHPLPRWAAMLNRAAAVLTSQGNLAGHLANVSREFRVPALFGLEGALERLKTGDVVTVDAEDRKVYAGRIEELLEVRGEPRNLMEGSPVHDALARAAEHILPLNLTDPGAPEFRADKCRTFHDITRFCHEMAVQEMFRFGRDHHFPERSSKQLLCEVAMQWWILNLDDGFREEVEGRYVRLENIVSVPMRAVWDGITAMPWEGPPPVDGKGLMSVMFEATRNTDLVPGMRSSYGSRNYFVISKHYCSLNSRLGFHFSIIEALVSDRAAENYVSFQYKGGAADMGRKRRRVLFIREILEEYDFKVEVKEDTLIARLAEQEPDYMKERLRILGFLTIHTRQLDMIMSNPDSLQYYRAKIKRDIRERILPLTAPAPQSGTPPH